MKFFADDSATLHDHFLLGVLIDKYDFHLFHDHTFIQNDDGRLTVFKTALHCTLEMNHSLTIVYVLALV